MAIALVQQVAFNAGADNTSPFTHSPALPTGITAGNLLILCLSSRASSPQNTLTAPTGFTLLADSNAQTVYWKTADGSESGVSVQNTGNSTRVGGVFLEISGAVDPAVTPPEITFSNATSTNPDPPSITPSWGSSNTFYVAIGASLATADCTAGPSGYSNFQTSRATNDPSVSSATKGPQAGAAENPGAFTLGTSAAWKANTIAIKEAGSTTSKSVSITQASTVNETDQVGKKIALSGSTALSVFRQLGRKYNINPVATSVSVVNRLTRAVAISIAQGTAVSVRRAMTTIIPVVSPLVVAITRAMSRRTSVVQTTAVSNTPLKALGKAVAISVQSTAVSVRRQTGKLVQAAALSFTISLRRAMGKLVNAGPDPNTLALFHFDVLSGGVYWDYSGRGHHVTPGTANVTLDTTNKKFGGGSVFFPGGTGSDTLNGDSSSDYALGTGDFTIEFFVRFDPTISTVPGLFQIDTGVSTNLRIFLDGPTLNWVDRNRLRATVASQLVDSIWAPNTDQWYYIALVRSSGTCQFYVDGVANGTPASAAGSITAGDLQIGKGTTRILLGNVEELRFSNTARYTGAFTPPTAPFPNAPGTLASVAAGLVKLISAAQSSAVSVASNRAYLRVVAVTQALSVSVVRQTRRLVQVAPVAATVNLIRSVGKKISATPTPVVNIARALSKRVSVIQATTVSIIRRISKIVQGAVLTLTARATNRAQKLINAAALSFTVSFNSQRAFLRPVSVAAVNTTVNLVRNLSKPIAFVITPVVRVVRQTARSITMVLSSTVSAIKRVGKPISRTLATVASSNAQRTYLNSITVAAVSTTVRVVRQSAKVIGPILTTTVRAVRAISIAVRVNALTLTVRVLNQAQKVIRAAALTLTVNLQRSAAKPLNVAVVALTVNVRRAAARIIAVAALTTTVRMIRQAGKVIQRTLATIVFVFPQRRRMIDIQALTLTVRVVRAVTKKIAVTKAASVRVFRSIGKIIGITKAAVVNVVKLQQQATFPDWPSTVPETVLVQGYQEVQENNVTEFKPEVGPPKLRRLSSSPSVRIRCGIPMTMEQFQTFLTWYRYTAKDGTTGFTFVHPRTGAIDSWYFLEPPQMNDFGVGQCILSIYIRRIPE